MAYVIHKDDATNRARIHIDTCRHYLNRKPGPLPDNRWHGPFVSLDAAWAKLKATGKSNVGECTNCLRQPQRAREV